MKPRLLKRRGPAARRPAPKLRAPSLEANERGSALRGLALYSAAIALSVASLTAQADSTRAVDAKPSGAAHTYVALHMQHYTGMCGESYSVAGPRRLAPVCLHEEDSAALEPELKRPDVDVGARVAPAATAALHEVR